MPKPKVTIVDDDRDTRELLSLALESEDFEVNAAANGLRLIASLQLQRPDVILMDVNMDQMDGFAATRAIGAEAATKAIPVVLVTSKNQKADRVWAQMLGVKGYVTKPYTPDQILGAIAALG